MKGIAALFLGIFGTFAFSWAGLILLPNYQIGHLDPQVDEDGNDPFPAPKSGMADRGRRVYAANGCVYCHSQQLRGEYAASDLEQTRDLNQKKRWGERRSAPRDYIFERPVMLGKMRLGPDLANIGKTAPTEGENAAPAANPAGPTAVQGSPPVSTALANSPAQVVPTSPTSVSTSPGAPDSTLAANGTPGGTPASDGLPLPYSAAWHHRHIYSPRRVVRDSSMPAYHFLYEKRRISGERAADSLKLGEEDGVPEGWEVVPTFDAKCLVAYLMSLDQSHALKELSVTAAAPPAAPAPPAPAPAKEAK